MVMGLRVIPCGNQSLALLIAKCSAKCCISPASVVFLKHFDRQYGRFLINSNKCSYACAILVLFVKLYSMTKPCTLFRSSLRSANGQHSTTKSRSRYFIMMFITHSHLGVQILSAADMLATAFIGAPHRDFSPSLWSLRRLLVFTHEFISSHQRFIRNIMSYYPVSILLAFPPCISLSLFPSVY
uniref:Transmembrane protein adipocyte-associated 1 homolog n=1 Tax=Parascaris univalens TaxID=6257 RepID=A0A915BRY7_PARUN